MGDRHIGILGATSFVGECLLPLLIKQDVDIIAFSRKGKAQNINYGTTSGITWNKLDLVKDINQPGTEINNSIIEWISLAPIMVLPEYLPMMINRGARRVVALSSTSRFTKKNSSDKLERSLATKFVNAEENFIKLAEQNDIKWTILRPTLIYGFAKDKNISEIIRFIQRFGIFPVFGSAQGKRQPIYIEDVANACYMTLDSVKANNQSYNISGGEILSYREMVERLFYYTGRRPRFLQLPISVFLFGIKLLGFLPKFKNIGISMIERMNQDMVFDNKKAIQDFGFSPQLFELNKHDIPK